MSGGARFILIAEGAHATAGDGSSALLGLAPPDGSGNSTTEIENYVPPCETRWHRQYREVTYIVSVLGIYGTAVTSWSLGARFRQRLTHTNGYQDAFPVWAPIQQEQIQKCIAEGVGWYGPGQTPPADPSTYGIIATQLTTADDASGVLPNGTLTIPGSSDTAASQVSTSKRVTVSRTVIHQLGGMRVEFLPTIVGGDATSRIVVGVVAEGKL